MPFSHLQIVSFRYCLGHQQVLVLQVQETPMLNSAGVVLQLRPMTMTKTFIMITVTVTEYSKVAEVVPFRV